MVDGTAIVGTKLGTIDTVSTTTKFETPVIVASYESGTFSIAHEAGTTAGDTQVDGIMSVASVIGIVTSET